ncbi:DUF456 domain-containing protein [Nocardioides solisilvae]|uniref:DUF456 domain-containing protein n=1 Tax=Nocardioides solisilvae TaxID=1542435 RepID=UPI000D74431C|nr:DUF456 domain-containing protein [Nocardioides solisilvae]
MTVAALLAAVLVAVGLVGILLPLVPGTSLVLLGVLGWAWYVGTATSWRVLAAVVVVLGAGAVAKYVVPGRGLRTAGVPSSTLWAGGALAAVGFFVVPVAGLLLGFVLGVHLAEVRRVGRVRARTSARHAVKAVLLSVAVELGAALLATAVWVVGLFLV